MVDEEARPRLPDPRDSPPDPRAAGPENDGKSESMFSPGFRSAAAMAGWDEETLLMASFVVEDTPDRQLKQRKRTESNSKKTPLGSKRKRRGQGRSLVPVPVTMLDLDDDDKPEKEEKLETRKEMEVDVGESKPDEQKSEVSTSTNAAFPCLDRLRDELSCAICLEICFEPSTTSCGHSFCKKCLKSAAEKCGKKCPKCRQLISNGRSCTVNTVLWNTIQLLFPQDVESRKAAAGACDDDRAGSRTVRTGAADTTTDRQNLDRRRGYSNGFRNSSYLLAAAASGENDHNGGARRRRRRREAPSQDEDAALALRLQREEFMEVFRGGYDEEHQPQHYRGSITSARANLRALASRQIRIRRTTTTP